MNNINSATKRMNNYLIDGIHEKVLHCDNIIGWVMCICGRYFNTEKQLEKHCGKEHDILYSRIRGKL